MTIALLIVLGCLLGLAVLVLGAVTIRARLMPAPPLTGRTVIVHTRRPDDQSLRGVLVAQHADRWTLRDAVYLEAGGGEHHPAGQIHVPVANIAWVQEVPAS